MSNDSRLRAVIPAKSRVDAGFCGASPLSTIYLESRNNAAALPSIDLVKSKVIPRISMEMSQTSSFTCLTNPLHHFENDSSLGIIISFFDGIRAYRSISV